MVATFRATSTWAVWLDWYTLGLGRVRRRICSSGLMEARTQPGRLGQLPPPPQALLRDF